MTQENNFIFMAFASGVESTEAVEIKRYIGVAPVSILAVNPTKKELEKIYNTTLEKEPEYLGEQDVEGLKVKTVRIDFIVKTDAEKCGVEMVTKIPFFLRDQHRYNSDKTKLQVIDLYGRTAWVTKEQYEKHEIPVYSNGPANLDKNYRPLFVGEEELTKFIKTYLGIPNVMKYVNNTWVLVDNTQDCEARLDGIKNYFTGNYQELKTVIALQPNNKIKALFGVRTTDDNKQYQSVYTQMFLNSRVSDYSKLEKDVQERKQAGAYSTTEFEVCPIKEYIVSATQFTSKAEENPFADDSDPWA
jgi:hypothetical protein